MKALTIDQHITQLVQLGSINCYLVREDDGFTLVDTCYPGAASFILHFAAELKTPVNRVILTHAHPDHVGSLDALRQKLPGVQVIMSHREKRIYEGDFSLDAQEAK